MRRPDWFISEEERRQYWKDRERSSRNWAIVTAVSFVLYAAMLLWPKR